MISSNKIQRGTLFGQRAEGVSPDVRPVEANANSAANPHSVAFAGLFVFTLLLYARPRAAVGKSNRHRHSTILRRGQAEGR
jgi:hypothetical protein